ncbi:MAG: HAMP domain-containing sensor histidine kinase [Dehalococcoidia bacterium]|nr:HAMP domain-containing sensor histidine kinase [Dehalococcoidia bacterium]
MRHLPLAISVIPALLGLLIGLTTDAGLLPVSSIFVFRAQATAGAMAALAGILVSGLALLALWLANRRSATLARALVEERRIGAEAHRRFIHRLNHELKNPLTAIRAGLANLDRPGALGSEASSLANVRQQVERLARLAEQLRKLADLEASEFERESVDLAEVVEEAVRLARNVPGRDDRRLEVQVQKVPWALSPVLGDRDLLLLALYNLLDNALKFSSAEAMVEVRASEDGARATVEVADTGPGISAEDLPHVAEELYRGRDAQGIEGSGLGLALVDRIAALHGGDLSLRSRQGQGTVVTLRVPLKGK